MSLWNVLTIAPCVTYVGDETFTTWPWVTFFYDPGQDRLLWYEVASIPPNGVELLRFSFNASDGSLIAREQIPFTLPNFYSIANCRSATMGSYNKIYGLRSSTAVYELDPRTLSYPGFLYFDGESLGWSVDPYAWDPASVYNFAVVNRINNYLAGAGAGGQYLDCWRNITTTPERFGRLALPGQVTYLAYESKKYLWAITKDGIILKADYTIPRWEMISTVQNPTADSIGYYVTFDVKRNRVVVLRKRQDALDGSAQHQLEFYYPMVDPYILTQPVPVSSLRVGRRIIFVAHLLGNAGEGLTPFSVTATLVPTAIGKLINPFSSTELNGRVSFQYQSAVAGTDTLQLSVTVEES